MTRFVPSVDLGSDKVTRLRTVTDPGFSPEGAEQACAALTRGAERRG